MTLSLSWLATVLSLSGLSHPKTDSIPGEVTIQRDEFGVPHIFAATIDAGYYGLGYAQGEDILEFILTLILRGRGELASVRGPSDLPTDTRTARWGHVEAAKAGFRRLDPELQAAYRRYIEGLSAFMAKHPEVTPAWAPRLEPWDAVVLTRTLLWDAYQAGMGMSDCRRAGITLANDAGSPSPSPLVASNEWALAPWRTAAGATIVLSDPHGEVDGSIFYEYRLHAGRLASSGYAFGPLLLLAHNRTLAWGETTGNPDVADCYEVEVDPKNPLRYQYDGRWTTMMTRKVTIAVKGGPPVTRTIEYTRHNGVISPVVARVGTKAYVVSTAYMDSLATPAFDQEIFHLNLAANVAEAKTALRTVGLYPQNFLFGDADGAIWYLRAGRTPIRPSGFDWNKPVPGNTSATAWRGIHPLEDLVQATNPPQGYLQNNNIAPDMMVPDGTVSADRYPSYVFNDTPGRTNTRALRAIEVLSRAHGFTIEDATELALDEKWYGTEAWLALLARALDVRQSGALAQPAELRRFIGDLLRFDGRARNSSTAALQFLYWQEAQGATVPVAMLPELDHALTTGTAPSDPLAQRLIDAVDSARVRLIRVHPGATPTLGDEFKIGPANRIEPMGGVSILPSHRTRCVVPVQWDRNCLVTLRAMTFGARDSTGTRRANIGSRALRLISLEKPVRAFSLHLYGQSNRSTSPHATDQLPLSSQRRLKPEWFERSELEGHVTSTVRLTVGAPHPDLPNATRPAR